MDDIVRQAIAKWPNVPDCYGWLGLDARGNWYMRDDSAQAAGSFASGTAASKGSLLKHDKLIEFIQRNYESDAMGRWFFQNGPQRVFVALDYTPWVYRLDDAGQGLLAHTGAVPRALEGVFLDDAGALLLKTEIGIGVLLDRDLPGFLERLADVGGRGLEGLLEEVARGAVTQAILQGRKVPIASVRSADVPSRFGFVARPAPRAGEPEC